jgi:Tol biopolymer transport system component
MVVDPAEAVDPTRPPFAAHSPGSKAYHGHPLLEATRVAGWCLGVITDPLESDSARGCSIGDAFVEAPDGSRAGLVWKVNDTPRFAVLMNPDAARWGSSPSPSTSRSAASLNWRSHSRSWCRSCRSSRPSSGRGHVMSERRTKNVWRQVSRPARPRIGRAGGCVLVAFAASAVGISCASPASVADLVRPSGASAEASPDPQADRIVFSSERDGHAQIYVMASDGTGQVNLSHSDFEDTSPSCRADGKEFGFLRSSPERLGDPGWFPTKLVVLDSFGNPVREAEGAEGITTPVASPDGLQAAVVADNEPDVQNGIFVVDADGIRRLTTGIDRAPSWSPDGERVAFQRDVGQGEWEIFVIGADGNGLEQLSTHVGWDASPSWSPDGRRITFASGGRDGKSDADIFVMNADGSSVARLTLNPDFDQSPAWSPNGSTIVFESGRGGFDNEIYAMNTDGTNQHALTQNDTEDLAPCWLPATTPSSGGV